jgi:hypothetical protein
MKTLYCGIAFAVYVIVSVLVFVFVMQSPSKSLPEGIMNATLTLIVLQACAGAFQLLPFSPRSLTGAFSVSCAMVVVYTATILVIQNPLSQLFGKLFDANLNNPAVILLGGIACTSVAFFIIRGTLWLLHRN